MKLVAKIDININNDIVKKGKDFTHDDIKGQKLIDDGFASLFLEEPSIKEAKPKRVTKQKKEKVEGE